MWSLKNRRCTLFPGGMILFDFFSLGECHLIGKLYLFLGVNDLLLDLTGSFSVERQFRLRLNFD